MATRNPIPSEAPEDLKFNAGKIDEEVNSDAEYYLGRLGKRVLTAEGRNNLAERQRNTWDSRFQNIAAQYGWRKIPYVAGNVLELRTEYVEIAGEGGYSLNYDIPLPYTLTGDWATESVNFTRMSDATLRADLADPEKGASLINYKLDGSETVPLSLAVRSGLVPRSVEEFGAKGDGSDDSFALRNAFEWSSNTGLPITGNGRTYHANAVILKSNSKIYDINIVHNKFDEDLNSVIQTGDGYLLENVYLENVTADGVRDKHTGVSETTLREDSGRNAFAIRGPVDGLTMVRCKGINACADGLLLYPLGATGVGKSVVRNVLTIDCEFTGNGRHGGSGDRVDGFTSMRSKWNRNGLDIDPSAPYSSGKRGRAQNGSLYGNGFDFEEYRDDARSLNISFIDSQGLSNAKHGILILRTRNAEQFDEYNNYKVIRGSYDKGLFSTDNSCLHVTQNGPATKQLFKDVTFTDVDCNGSYVIVRGCSKTKAINLINCPRLSALEFSEITTTFDQFTEVTSTTTRKYIPLFTRKELSLEDGNLVRGLTNYPGDSTKVIKDIWRVLAGNDSYCEMRIEDTSKNLRAGIRWFQSGAGPMSTSFLNGISGAENIALTILSPGHILPGSDNVQNLGSASLRYAQIFAGTGTINTSDERDKTRIQNINEAALRAWSKVDFKQFKFKDAVERKGNDARWHFGVIAQEVKDAFESEGLDPFEYGILCYDEWPSEEAQLAEDETVISEAVEAGNRYGVRYDEALALECAYLRSKFIGS